MLVHPLGDRDQHEGKRSVESRKTYPAFTSTFLIKASVFQTSEKGASPTVIWITADSNPSPALEILKQPGVTVQGRSMNCQILTVGRSDGPHTRRGSHVPERLYLAISTYPQ
jgi:hypothetical protein